jgi:hypothetical protein
VKLTRREVLAGAAAAALGGAGIYELVDRLGGGEAPMRKSVGRMGAAEQHALELGVVEHEGVEVVVPPLHHRLVTARVAAEDPRAAQRDLETALRGLEEQFDPTTPAGLGVTVAWGLPYFERVVPHQAHVHLPVDRRASVERRKHVLLDAIRFPSDPEETVLERNDVAVLLRSDIPAHVSAGAKELFQDLDVFSITSVRTGFVGGGLPKRMATAAGIRGAELIPDGAQLFLGFTSTQKAALGPRRIANFETLGYADLGPHSYFRGGTNMHVSHLFEDVEAWYLNFDFRERVDTAFTPGLDVEDNAQTVPQGPPDVAHEAQVKRTFRDTGRIGHSGAIQTSSRLQRDVMGDDGTLYKRGTAIPQRADFDTLDNPFSWSSDPVRDAMQAVPAAGVHFVVFNPTSDDFHRNRLAMDGVLPDGTRLPLPARARGQGFNSVLRTTHRQNFLVPPRAHRAFPLAEL